ncbi:hypothetical protein F5050DRAFT_1809929 [Lentinula boryana]|uniref:Uncharacterized protein n=1 Tax=Lentinula boryana TaxID=40481 RepID=A0ABQ8Q6H7_9AGAR|nr:hypothetical protein F5050DRAFT_1809929 [Lentinula boryana]
MWEVKKGGPKTASCIGMHWKKIKGIFEAILAVKQKRYVGASGWNHDDADGFGVTDTNREEWNSFVKAHPIFKPFITKSWEFLMTLRKFFLLFQQGIIVRNTSRIRIGTGNASFGIT